MLSSPFRMDGRKAGKESRLTSNSKLKVDKEERDVRGLHGEPRASRLDRFDALVTLAGLARIFLTEKMSIAVRSAIISVPGLSWAVVVVGGLAGRAELTGRLGAGGVDAW